MNNIRKRVLKLMSAFFVWVIGLIFEDPIKENLKNITNINMTTYKIIIVICMIFTVLTMLIYWKVKDFIDNINKQINSLKQQNYCYAQHLIFLKTRTTDNVFKDLGNIDNESCILLDKRFLLGIIHPSKSEIDKLQNQLINQ